MKPKAYAYMRFSTPEQSKGHSLTRQDEAIKKFVEKHDLELDSSLSMNDFGISSFRGDNWEKGLGAFLSAVDAGAIQKGSYLIFESWDRFSRQPVLTVLTKALSIIDKDIKIATLTDGEIYDKSSNSQQLIISLTIMERAHEESKRKSGMLSGAWGAKRKNAKFKKVTSRCPAWLVYNKEKDTFELDKGKSAVVREIFDLALSGVGKDKIVAMLNARKEPTFTGKGEFWHGSYVEKILKNEATIGRFQPYRSFVDETTNKRKRVMDGEPIDNYFEPAIEEGVFYKVQAARKSRRVSTTGRKGSSFSNILTRLVKCGYCGSTMHYINKGKPPKGFSYLVCGRARTGAGCTYKAWRYDHVESSFLHFAKHLDVASIFPHSSEDKEISVLRFNLSKNQNELAKQKSICSNIQSTIERAIEIDKVNDKLIEMQFSAEKKLQDLEVENNELSASLEQSISSFEDSKVAQKNLSTLLDGLAELTGDGLYQARSKLHQHIKTFVKEVSLYPQGDAAFDELTTPTSFTYKDDIITVKPLKFRDIDSDSKFLIIKFKSGEIRVIFPNESNPEELHLLTDATIDNIEDVKSKLTDAVLKLKKAR